MRDPIPFLSVCSGIGAPEVAWADTGMHSVLCSEIEDFPRAVLAYRFGARDARLPRLPHAGPDLWPALWGDFTALRPRHLRRMGIALPSVLVGGTPCQSFSVAGKRGSLSDPRGNLSLAYVRLAHALASAQAGFTRTLDDDGPVFYAAWENVPGVLSTRDNAFGCFVSALVGGDAPLVPPDAKWGGVVAFDRRSHDVQRAFGWQSCKWPGEGMVEGPVARACWRVLDAQHFRVPQRRRRVFVVVGFGAGADPAEVLLEFDGLPGDLAPGQGAEEDPAATLAGGARRRGGYSTDDVPLTAATLDASFGRLQGCSGQDANHGHSHLIPMAYGGNNTSGPIEVATALSAHGGPHGRLDFESETFIAHTLRGEGFDASEDGHALSAAARPPAIAFSSKDHGADAGDIAPTLRAMGHAGSHAAAFGVRRLTPTECARLQSFPDDHARIPWRGAPAEACPDGPQYRAYGNSMNCEVMRWLGRRLARAIRRAGATRMGEAAE